MSITTTQIVNFALCSICLLVDIFYVRKMRAELAEIAGTNPLLSKTTTVLSWIVSFGIILIPVMWVQWTYTVTAVIALLYIALGLKPMIRHIKAI